ncbi:MAG: flagellar basal body rod protein FlgC, partial [Gammaproteobacteria bacterium TMED30]
MSLENIFGMAGGAMDAQSKRLALAVENIANSDVLAGDQASAYKAKRVNFAT